MPRFELNDADVVVIVGSGAGGGTMANELTRRGLKVVLFEAGKRQTLATFSQDPGEAFGQLTWLEPRSQSGTWDPVRTSPTLPAWHCRTVGGTTVHWTAATPRLQSYELRARSVYGDIPGASLADWPIEYAELKRWYQVAEKRLGVTRRNGNPGMPASNNFKVMYAGARRLGYKRVHTNYMAINSRTRDGRGFCIQQGFCAQGCKTGAKWSTLYAEIPRAEASGKLDLRSECFVTRIEHDGAGRASGVVYRDAAGVEQRQRARIVCVAGNAIETARLLLLSESGRFKHGLANGSDQVGRNYCHHVLSFVFGIFDQPVSFWRGAVLAGVVEDENRHDPSRGFAGGYHLELAMLDLPTLPLIGLPYGWGRDFASIIDNYRNMAGMLVNGEDLPRADNRISLSRTQKDPYGLPVAHIHCDPHANDLAMRAHATGQGQKIYEAVGAKRTVVSGMTPATHQMGTARMSHDPGQGVTNAYGRAHDVPNLFISDGSVQTTAGAANPTLTIVALVLRQAEHIGREVAGGRL
jgi:choline dehydrogenase-like flavoprotein